MTQVVGGVDLNRGGQGRFLPQRFLKNSVSGVGKPCLGGSTWTPPMGGAKPCERET